METLSCSASMSDQKPARFRIRLAQKEDAAVLAAIYAPYVRNTAVTFEYDPPDAAEFRRRIQAVQGQFPYLVCEENGIPKAYAYASRFHERAAFQWDAELSVYVAEGAQQQGMGRALYGCLMEFLQEQGYTTLYALITSPNDPSERMHTQLGFQKIAVYPQTGYKLGMWRDMTVWEKRMKPLPENPIPPRKFSTLPMDFVENVLQKAATERNLSR